MDHDVSNKLDVGMTLIWTMTCPYKFDVKMALR